MGLRSYDYFPLYRLTNLRTNETFETRGWRPLMELAGLSRKTPSNKIKSSKKWKVEEISPPLKWDQQSYRRELYKNTKDRYKGYEQKKLLRDPLYEKRKQLRLKGWLNLDGSDFTAEQHSEMYLLPCEICKSNTKDIVVDHCHNTNVVRGSLCRKCNIALGHVNDSTKTLESMIQYLEKYKSVTKHSLQ